MTDIFKKTVHKLIKTNSYSDCERIVLGGLIELKINNDCIDVYKYVNLNNIKDDYDFDQDYLTTIYF